MTITLVCRQCKKPYQCKPYRLHESHVCSAQCRSDALSAMFRAKRIQLVCHYCSKAYERIPSQAPRSKYCSAACQRLAKAVPVSALLTYITNQDAALLCAFCGKPFVRKKSRLQHGRGKHCSPSCQYAARRAKPRKAVQRTCLHCGQTFERAPSWLNAHKGAGKYCSRICRDTHRIQKNHPQYLNGSASESRGPNWQAQKRKAKKRDHFTCQHCGLTQEQSLANTEASLQVHHIIPFRLFTSYKLANRLPNLVTLCESCHRTADAAFQRGERYQQQLSLPF
jgi:5-methylcytosine-specific restriction endonuclease McrA